MFKKGLLVTAFLAIQLIITGCAQEKVMDTEFIRLQNKVKDLETTLQQKEEQFGQLSQKVVDMENQLNAQKEQLSQWISSGQNAQTEERYPVIIQDVQLTSEKMDSEGRIWGNFNLVVTLYNGTEQPVSDSLSAILVEDHPDAISESPKTQNFVLKFDIKPKESKTITFTGLPINEPSKRLNVVVKLLEQTKSGSNGSGTLGKATWVVVPTVISEP